MPRHRLRPPRAVSGQSRAGLEALREVAGGFFVSSIDDTSCTYTFLVLYVLTCTGAPPSACLFPFLEVPMHRRGVQKSSSVSAFKGRVGVTDKVNLQRNRRGGIRL